MKKELVIQLKWNTYCQFVNNLWIFSLQHFKRSIHWNIVVFICKCVINKYKIDLMTETTIQSNSKYVNIKTARLNVNLITRRSHKAQLDDSLASCGVIKRKPIKICCLLEELFLLIDVFCWLFDIIANAQWVFQFRASSIII